MCQLTLQIDTHQRENNAVSEAFLQKHSHLFALSAFNVLKCLIEGNELTTVNAPVIAGTRSLPRRIKDLKDNNGFKISDRWQPVAGGTGYKVWYMSEADKQHALQQLMQKLAA